MLKLNVTGLQGFREFVFFDGMLFNSMKKWWGDMGSRPSPHEGLDLAMYEDEDGVLKKISPDFMIPAAMDGVITAVINDILGKSVFLGHDFYDSDRRLHTVYAHVVPAENIHAGGNVRGGELLAEISSISGKKGGIVPHLHLSVAWIPDDYFPDRINWREIGLRKGIVLSDPAMLFNAPLKSRELRII